MNYETTHTIKPNRAVFLDRDGTIMEDNGHIACIKDVSIYPFTVDALKMLQKKFLLFIVTNQSGVGLGRVSREAVEKVNLHVMSVLKAEGVTIQQIYCCSHSRDQNCECIKPKSYFITKAQKEFNIAVTESYSIGDHPHDVEFGEAAGGTGLYVLTGHGRKHMGELKSTTKCFPTLYHAAQWIRETNQWLSFDGDLCARDGL